MGYLPSLSSLLCIGNHFVDHYFNNKAIFDLRAIVGFNAVHDP